MHIFRFHIISSTRPFDSVLSKAPGNRVYNARNCPWQSVVFCGYDEKKKRREERRGNIYICRKWVPFDVPPKGTRGLQGVWVA